jgi:hypothetical protein
MRDRSTLTARATMRRYIGICKGCMAPLPVGCAQDYCCEICRAVDRREFWSADRVAVDAKARLSEYIAAAAPLQPATVQGSQGEISLKRGIELAGMSEYCRDPTQQTFLTDDGRRLRPEMIVNLRHTAACSARLWEMLNGKRQLALEIVDMRPVTVQNSTRKPIPRLFATASAACARIMRGPFVSKLTSLFSRRPRS